MAKNIENVDSSFHEPSYADMEFRKWLKTIIRLGDELQTHREELKDIVSFYNQDKQSYLSDAVSSNEHFFIVAASKAVEWGRVLSKKNLRSCLTVSLFIDSLPDVKLLRNMREHDIEYIEGKGRKQEKFITEFTIDEQQACSSTALASLEVNKTYIIGGRLDVYETCRQASVALRDLPEVPLRYCDGLK